MIERLLPVQVMSNMAMPLTRVNLAVGQDSWEGWARAPTIENEVQNGGWGASHTQKKESDQEADHIH